MILVCYDVSTASKEGARRLRRVAKICLNHGQRVQNSVFECSITPAMFVTLKKQLKEVIDCDEDNIRFYLLGKNWERRVETIGVNNVYNPDTDLLIL